MQKVLLYLHGFRSVGLCYKGKQIASFAPNSLTPNLPYVPDLAISYAESLIQKYGAQNLCLIGSSLGGYYATFLAEKYSKINRKLTVTYIFGKTGTGKRLCSVQKL